MLSLLTYDLTLRKGKNTMTKVKQDTELILVERHIISSSHPYFSECDHLTFLGKNLYNATLFYQRASFFKKDFQNYYEVNRVFTHENQADYRALPAKVSKQVQMLVDRVITLLLFESLVIYIKQKDVALFLILKMLYL